MAEPRFDRFFIYDEHPEDTLEARAERAEAERIYFTEVKPRLEERERLDRLYKTAIEKGVNVDNIYEDTREKRKQLLSIMNYKRVKTDRTEVIGSIYKERFYAAKDQR